MFKIDQFSAANEAALDQFSKFAQLSLANIEKSFGQRVLFDKLGMQHVTLEFDATGKAQLKAGDLRAPLASAPRGPEICSFDQK